MLWIAVLFAVIIAVAAVAAVVWPLLKPGPAPVMVEDDRVSDLVQRKDATLQAIKDLEFDYHVGKLSADDFQKYDQRLRRQAMALMQQIDQVAPESTQFDAAIEAQISQRRKVRETAPAVTVVTAAAGAPTAVAGSKKQAAAPPPAQAPVQPAPAAQSSRFCTNCGSPLEPQHKFCANCGAPVAAAAAAPQAAQS